MRVGLIARSEDRGLGHMTWDFHRHVKPDRTLLIDMGALSRGFAQHPERYSGDVLTLPFNSGVFDEQLVRDWLVGLDVVYSAETFYDWRVVEWARAARVTTVLHVMPEFWRDDVPQPDVIWLPTSWRRDTFSCDTRVVPVPVSRPNVPPCSDSERLRVVHVAGNRAAGDRNGTILAMNASRYARSSMLLRVETQGQRLPSLAMPRHVELQRHAGGRRDRWQMYEHADVLLMPRRYGGLCLPALEAMASGLAVVMPGVPPNDEWPIVSMPSSWRGTIETPCGQLPMAYVEPRTIAATLDQLADDRSTLAAAQLAAMRWAIRNSWEELLPRYEHELTRACERVTW